MFEYRNVIILTGVGLLLTSSILYSKSWFNSNNDDKKDNKDNKDNNDDVELVSVLYDDETNNTENKNTETNTENKLQNIKQETGLENLFGYYGLSR